MPCDTGRGASDGAVFICRRGRRTPPKCSVAGCHGEGRFLCDFPAGAPESQTCSKPICARHRTPPRQLHLTGAGEPFDYCPTCAAKETV